VKSFGFLTEKKNHTRNNRSFSFRNKKDVLIRQNWKVVLLT